MKQQMYIYVDHAARSRMWALIGEAMVHRLDLKGIAVATGAACNSRETVASHVLKAIEVGGDLVRGTLCISFGSENTVEDALVIASEMSKMTV